MRQGRWSIRAIFAGALALTAGLSPPAQAQVSAKTFVAPSSFFALPQKGRVVLSWAPVANPVLVGYNVYRRNAGETADKTVLMNATPLVITSAVDAGADNKGLQNGKSYIYSVKAVYTGSDGKPKEGPATPEVVATPQVPIKNLFTLYDLQTLSPGSAFLDNTNVLTVQASGADIWDTQDGQSFLAVPVSGDLQVTAKLTERPSKVTSGTNNFGKFGLQIKTDLRVGAPYAFLFASVIRDPEYLFEGRKRQGGGNTFSDGNGINSADAAFPVWFRMIRKGRVIGASLSFDGTNFQPVGFDQDFGTLPPVLYVGIAATAHQDNEYVQGKLDFSTLKIENAP